MKEFDDKYLNDGKLHIDFQYYFKNDTAVIKRNGEYYEKYVLTTGDTTSVAASFEIPNFSELNTISISINGGPEAILKIDNLNQIIVRFKKNKELFIGYRKHVPYYD